MTNKEWTVTPSRFSELSLTKIWAYRYLLYQFVYRDLVSLYKQTILGPIWFVIQPILTTIAFSLIFGNFAKVSADGLPRPLFYLAGIIIWNYFSECFTKTAGVFREHIGIFGKIYFPRIIVPISIIIGVFARFGMQFVLFLSILLLYHITGHTLHYTWTICLFPLLVLLIAIQGLGLGLIMSALTIKYRDLVFLMAFGLQLFMYSTTVIYPLSTAPENFKWLIQMNPVTAVIETFRFGFLGKGSCSFAELSYSASISTVLLVCGIVIFSKAEKKFIDTI
jgi:lipopolysaccharide transport system permease protein